MKTTLNRSIRIARTLLPALLVVAATGFAAVEEGEDRQSRRGARRPSSASWSSTAARLRVN